MRLHPAMLQLLRKRLVGKWLALIFVVFLVGGWRGFLIWQAPKHLTEIARAHGYVGLIYGVPRANTEGSRIAYSQMSEAGIGVFLMDLASNQKKLIHEKLSTDDWFRTVDVWPWSPGGKYFIYTHTNLCVCDGLTGNQVGELPVEGFNGVASLAWLTDDSFVYVSKAGNLHQIKMTRPDSWEVVDNKRIRAGADCLSAISPDVVCWQKANCIWSANLTSNTVNLLFHGGTNRLEGFTYSGITGKFLVNNGAGKDGNTISQMILDGAAMRACEPSRTFPSAHQVQTLAGTNGACAYISDNPEKSEKRYLDVLTDGATGPIKLFDQGIVDAMAASGDGRKLFVVGSISNEPASSIWEYDLHSERLQCVIPGLTYPSPYARRMEARQITVTLGPGKRFNYHVYEPAGLDPQAHRKYPLVIGDTLFKTLDPAYQNRTHGPDWAPMLANAGAFVVIVERPGAWLNEIDRWEEYVGWVHQKMLRNPTIDPGQVYLFATSAETEHLTKFAEKDPKPWKGLILLNPVELPDSEKLSKSGFPLKILVSKGALEWTNQMPKYQLTAAGNGIRVEYYAHEGTSHILLGKKVLGERAEAITKFVFGD